MSFNWLSGIQTETDGELIAAPVSLCSVCNLGNIPKKMEAKSTQCSTCLFWLFDNNVKKTWSRLLCGPTLSMPFVSLSTLEVWCKRCTHRNTADATDNMYCSSTPSKPSISDNRFHSVPVKPFQNVLIVFFTEAHSTKQTQD